jgi:hypothetical protein
LIRHIVFRCPHCRTTTSVQAEWTARDTPAVVVCANCNASFQLASKRDRGLSNRDYYERVRRFATENSIDLASAYSILEGILPRDRVRTLARNAPDVPKPSASPLRAFALAAAVLVGLAVLGGQLRDRAREARADRPEASAREAVRALPDAPGVAARTTVPAPPPTTTFVPLVLQTNDQGRLTKIAGPDPNSVLEAFCRQEEHAGRFSPVTVAAATPPRPGLRLGVMRDHASAGGLLSVKIWLDAANSRWSIGNGRTPVQPEPVELRTASQAPAGGPTQD